MYMLLIGIVCCYVRMCCVALISMRFSHLLEEYKSDLITDIAKELSTLLETIVFAIPKKYLIEAMIDGKPLIRPYLEFCA